MIEFNNTNDKRGIKFNLWRLSHTRWFVINAKSAEDMMIHRVGCPHFEFSKKDKVNLVANTKYCSEDNTELQTWARKQGVRLQRCKTCM